MRTRRAQWVRAAAGWYSGDGVRWERAAPRGGDGGAAWQAPWERVAVGQMEVSAGFGSGRVAESSAGERRMGAGCGRWHISGCSGTVAARVVVQGRGNEKRDRICGLFTLKR